LLGDDIVLILGQERDSRWRWVRWARWREKAGLTEILPIQAPSRTDREKRFATADAAVAHFRRLLGIRKRRSSHA